MCGGEGVGLLARGIGASLTRTGVSGAGREARVPTVTPPTSGLGRYSVDS